MSCLSAVEAQLPPGFRFHPKDEELICDYLIKWITGSTDHTPFLIEVDLNKCEPWDLPEAACVGGKEWYFYSQRDRKYATGLRTNRATISGYWKATGKDRPAVKNGTVVGMRKTLVFYQGRAPKGRKTDWIMHEFRLEGNMNPDSKILAKADWVLCRVFYKNRSEVTTQKQEKSCIYNNEISLPQLMEPHIIYNNTTLEPCLDNQYHEQVPCFSNFTQSQTCPNTFPQVLPSTRIMPTSLPGNSCDEKVVKALLSHITNLGSGTYNNISDTFLMMESPSLGERSSDSYLSEVGGLSSIWDQYS